MIWWQFTLSCLKQPGHRQVPSKTRNKAPRYSLQCTDAERYLLPDVSTLSLLAKRENWCTFWVFFGILLCQAVQLSAKPEDFHFWTHFFWEEQHKSRRWVQPIFTTTVAGDGTKFLYECQKGAGGWEGGLWEKEKRKEKDEDTDLLHEKRTQSWQTCSEM